MTCIVSLFLLPSLSQLLQELCTVFNVDLPCRVKSSQLGIISNKQSSTSSIVKPQPSSCSYICQHCLVHLGDIGETVNTSQLRCHKHLGLLDQVLYHFLHHWILYFTFWQQYNNISCCSHTWPHRVIQKHFLIQWHEACSYSLIVLPLPSFQHVTAIKPARQNPITDMQPNSFLQMASVTLISV